jgi:hypothetical protein
MHGINAKTEIESVLSASYPCCSGGANELKESFGAYVEAKQKQNVLYYDDLLLYWAILRSRTTSAIASTMCSSTIIRTPTGVSRRFNWC